MIKDCIDNESCTLYISKLCLIKCKEMNSWLCIVTLVWWNLVEQIWICNKGTGKLMWNGVWQIRHWKIFELKIKLNVSNSKASAVSSRSVFELNLQQLIGQYQTKQRAWHNSRSLKFMQVCSVPCCNISSYTTRSWSWRTEMVSVSISWKF